MKLVRLAALAAAALALAAFAGVLQPGPAIGQASEPETRRLTVVGTGSVDVTPDRASFTFGTVSQARTAAAALEASANAVARVVAALRREGIAQADIQTSDVSLSPRWSENGETIIGYAASNSVAAIVRRLGQSGAVIDAAVAAGANQMWGPSLLAADTTSAYRDAMRAAIASARTKAQALASASGATPGRITAIAEESIAPTPLAATDTERAAGAQIEPGTQEIEARIRVTFELG